MLVDKVVNSFRVTKVFRDNQAKTRCFEYSPSGHHIVSCNEDNQIVIYDSNSGELSTTVNSKKYGVDRVRFAGNTDTVVHASTKIDDTIRYFLFFFPTVFVYHLYVIYSVK